MNSPSHFRLTRMALLRRMASLSLILFSLLPSCSHDADISKIDTIISYKSDIAPIVTSNCSMCHNNNQESSFESYSELMGIVTPGDSKGSDFYRLISTSWSFNRMPPSPADPLTKLQRSKIDLWILQGAKNN